MARRTTSSPLRGNSPPMESMRLAFAGGDALVECMDSLRRGGRVAHPGGVEPAPRPRKHVRLKSYDAEASPERFRQLTRAVVAAKVKVPIAQVFPLAEAAAAHRRIQKGHALGKIVLKCRPQSPA